MFVICSTMGPATDNNRTTCCIYVNCGDFDSGGSSDAAPILFGLMAILAIIVIFVGFIYAIILALAYIQKVFADRVQILNRAELTMEYKVVDPELENRIPTAPPPE